MTPETPLNLAMARGNRWVLSGSPNHAYVNDDATYPYCRECGGTHEGFQHGNHREEAPMTHWHVQRHSDDDDPYVTAGIYDALDYAATQLGNLADFEHDGIMGCGEAGAFEEAYRCWERSELYGNLADNAANVVRQHREQDAAKRAPLYQGDGWEAALLKHAMWTASEINGKAPRGFMVWYCGYGLVTVNAGTADEMETCASYVM
jgi:hypothetical protein